MMLLAALVSAVLAALAALHLLWAARLWVPLGDEAALSRAVAGFAGAPRMPGPAACLAVAALCAAGAIWPWLPAGRLVTAGLAAMALVFLLRGAAAYSPAFRRLTPEQPFARLDRRYYGPLCLGIGAAAGILYLTNQGVAP